MPTTYTYVTGTTVGTATNQITFNSISGSFTDLIVVIVARAASSNCGINMRFNNDTAGNYGYMSFAGTGSALDLNGASSDSSLLISDGAGLNSTLPSLYIVEIFDYASTTFSNTVTVRAGVMNSSSAGRTGLTGGMWQGGASPSATTRIDFNATIGGQFAVGSTFNIYGILKQ